MIEGQCKTWPGPMVAVIYTYLELFDTANPQRLEEAKAVIAELHARMEAEPGACALNLVLMSEAVQPGGGWAYPYNPLRNQAIARARTKLIFMLDVDFIPNADMYRQLTSAESYGPLLTRMYAHKHLVAMPAFEINRQIDIARGLEIAHDLARNGSKAAVLATLASKDMYEFGPYYPAGHRATNFKRWYRTTTQPYYHIKWEDGFEPFVMVSRLHVPWFDERFRGYGWDKISHVYQMAYARFNFTVHGQAFVVHRPHPPSAAYNATFSGPAYTSKHRSNEEKEKLRVIWNEMRADIKYKRYPTYGVSALAACRPVHWFKGLETEIIRGSAIARRVPPKERDRKIEFLRGTMGQPVVPWW